jgi:hypothetical protein
MNTSRHDDDCLKIEWRYRGKKEVLNITPRQLDLWNNYDKQIEEIFSDFLCGAVDYYELLQKESQPQTKER